MVPCGPLVQDPDHRTGRPYEAGNRSLLPTRNWASAKEETTGQKAEMRVIGIMSPDLLRCE